MRTYYYVILIFLLVTLIYVYFDDKCQLEQFIQENNKFCTDKKASNYVDSSNINKEEIDNSFCTYDKHIICDRPNAQNYFIGNLIEPEYNCPDKEAYNFEDYEYELDSSGNKIIIDNNDLDSNRKYCGWNVSLKDGKYYRNDELVYKLKKCPNLKICKYIENKICKFPMSNLKINSLKGITFGDDEFDGLLLKSENGEELDEYKLLENNYIINGAQITPESSKIRKNLFKLYTRLFNNDGSIVNEEGLNIWDKNGKIDNEQLLTNKDKVYDLYLSNNGKIISRLGYGLNEIPSNYYQLVKNLNKKNIHVSLAVNDSATKYAIGVGRTKSEAVDVALIRCITFVSLKEIYNIFNKSFNNDYGNKDSLVNIVHQKLDLSNSSESSSNFWAKIGSIFKKPKNIVNPKSSPELEKESFNLKQKLNNNDASGLGKKLLNLTSHRDIIDKYNINVDNLEFDEFKCKIDGNLEDRTCPTKPTVQEVLKYIYSKCKRENETDKCGILMVNENRYLNLDMYTSLSDSEKNLFINSSIPNYPFCKHDKCNEVIVLGLNKETKETHIFRNVKNINDKNYDRLPVKNDKNKWINEKDDILKNSKVDLVLNTYNNCKEYFEKCILYKVNNEDSSYKYLY